MHIGILSRKASLYSTRRLREAAEQRDHDVRVIDYLRCVIDTGGEDGGPRILFRDEILDDFDAVIPRIGASRTYYGTAVVRQFEMMGVHSAVDSDAISRSRDKLRTLQLLSRSGVGQPHTAFAHSSKDIDAMIESVGGAPLVVKLLEGTQGIGVVLAETRKAAQSTIQAFRQLDANLLVQEFIGEADGRDIRAFVVDDEVVASMQRTAPPGEFRANIHRGGSAQSIELKDQEAEIAVHAARSLGLGVAGVDLLRSDRGPLVLEINSSPGLEGIESSSGKDVASQIIANIERAVTGDE
jgi:ribosomal protein S6--L-glutamate ligase